MRLVFFRNGQWYHPPARIFSTTVEMSTARALDGTGAAVVRLVSMSDQRTTFKIAEVTDAITEALRV